MRRVLFLSLAIGGLFLGLAGSGRAADEVQAILDKAIKAHGGEAKLAAIKAIKTKSRGSSFALFTFDQEGKSNEEPMDFTRETSFLFPDRFKEDTSTKTPLGNVRTVSIFNKDKGSSHMRGVISYDRDLKGNGLTDPKEQLYRKRVSWLVRLKDKAYTLSPLGEVKVADKPAVGVQVKAKGFRDIDLFFDKKSGLLVKTRYRLREKGKEFAEEEIVTEYQKIDGVSVPKKIAVHRAGEEVGDEEFVETKLLETLDEKEFAAPRKGKDKAPRRAVRVPEAERAAVRAVEALGGKVGQEGEGQPITVVDLSETQATDAALKELKGLKELRALGLVGCEGVTDAGLKELKGLKGLQELFLGGTGVTDAGLKELKGLKELRELGLGRTRVTDAGLKELQGLKELRQLFLFETKVTDAGLKELKELKKLRQLYLGKTEVTDEGVAKLKKALPELTVER